MSDLNAPPRPGEDCEGSVKIGDVRVFCGMIAAHPGTHRYWKHDETNLHIEWGGIPRFRQEESRRSRTRPPFDRPDSEVREQREAARREHMEAHG